MIQTLQKFLKPIPGIITGILALTASANISAQSLSIPIELRRTLSGGDTSSATSGNTVLALKYSRLKADSNVLGSTPDISHIIEAKVFRRLDSKTVLGISAKDGRSTEALNDIGVAAFADSPSVKMRTFTATGFRQLSKQVALSSSAIYRTSSYGDSYMLWIKAEVRTPTGISLSLAMRPSYDDIIDRWTNAVELGAGYSISNKQTIRARMIQTSRRKLEPAVRYILDYEVEPVRNLYFMTTAGTAGGEDYPFNQISMDLKYYIQNNIGLSASYSARTKSLPQRQLGWGLAIRF